MYYPITLWFADSACTITLCLLGPKSNDTHMVDIKCLLEINLFAQYVDAFDVSDACDIHPVLYIRNSTSQLESGFSYLLCHFSGSTYKKSIKIQTINWYGWAMFDLDGFWLYKSQVMKNPTIFLVFLLSSASTRLYCASTRLYCASTRLYCASTRFYFGVRRLYCGERKFYYGVRRKLCTKNSCFSRWII